MSSSVALSDPQNHSVRQTAAEQIRAAIVAGELLPGQRLPDRMLGELTGVGRTTVREAVRQLEAEGLLTVVAHRGPTVAVLTEQETRDLYELRAMLEGQAAAEAARWATAADVARLAAIHARLMQARREGDGPVLLAENERFHFGVIAIARMPVLRRVVETLWTQAGPTISLLSTIPRPISPNGHPHDTLLRALEAHDPASARVAVERDLREHALIVAPLLQ